MRPVVASVAGVDPGGGAGIHADKEAFHSLGLAGAGVVTLLTVQDDEGVHRLEPVEADLVRDQLECLDVSRLRAVKAGALATPDNVAVVRDFVQDRDVDLVVDPVLVAASGGQLGTEGIDKAFHDLFSQARVVTPNIPEARTLTGETLDDPAALAKALLEKGPDHVIVTGGHGATGADVLAGPEGTVEIPGPVVEGSVHGTGCVHSSLVAGLVARGASVADTARLARLRVARRVATGRVPRRAGPVVAGRDEAMRRAVFWVERLQERIVDLPESWFPEVGTNVAVHVDGCLATLRDRIRRGRGLAGAGPAEGGHVARLLAQARIHDPEVTCAVNLAPRGDLVSALEDRGEVVLVDRTGEPDRGTSMDWVIDRAVEVHGHVPDAVRDEGSRGKEAMVRVLGRSPGDLLGILDA